MKSYPRLGDQPIKDESDNISLLYILGNSRSDQSWMYIMNRKVCLDEPQIHSDWNELKGKLPIGKV